MALKTSHSSANLVITSGLVISYSSMRVNGTWTGYTVVASAASVTYTSMWEAHRYARMGFRYVGMTRSAANSCKAAMISKYTRSQKYQEWSPTAGTMGDWVPVAGTQEILMADISIDHNEDGSYDVVVSVNEDDIYMSKAKVSPGNDALYFSGTRTYEE